VNDLRSKVKARHPDEADAFEVNFECFRPNLVIETGEAYSEDLYAEMRVGTLLLRNVGPTIRCNAVRMNWDKNDRYEDKEPNATLQQYRNVKGLGNLFGMYYQ